MNFRTEGVMQAANPDLGRLLHQLQLDSSISLGDSTFGLPFSKLPLGNAKSGRRK
jgi:hypothetical protein